MNELALAARQAAADLSQALRPPELAEQHRHELVPASESSRAPHGAGLAYELFELVSRKELEQLAESGTESVHGLGLLGVVVRKLACSQPTSTLRGCPRGFDHMRLGKRQWPQLKWVLARKETYVSLIRALWVVKQPIRTIYEEVFSSSPRRGEVWVRTPLGAVKIHLRSAVDLSTVLGVFCREDYRPPPDSRVIMDVGANLGIATLFFLSRDRGAFVYAYEPVQENVGTFRENVEPFGDRCRVSEVAVGTESGTVDFGVEPTGKFGGIHFSSERTIRVRCLAINDILEGVVSKHGKVDCLKIDVEGSEREILASMDHSFWSRIRCIYAENCDSRPFMPDGFVRSFRYNVERLSPA